jgi:hypothetical protein
MPVGKEFSTTIDIKGKVDESVARSIGLTVRELEQFKKSVADINKISSRVNLKANGLLPPPQEIQNATRMMGSFHNKLSDIMTIAEGTGIGFLLAQGFDFAIAQAGRLAEAVGHAVNLAADFETQKLELGIDVGFSEKQIQEYVNYLYKTSASVPVTVPTALEATRLIASSISIADPERKEEEIKKTLEMLENIAAATTPASNEPVAAFNEHLRMMAENYTKMIKAGVTLERNIYPLEAGGLNVRPAMIETLEKMKGEGLDIDPKNFDLLSREIQDKLLGELAKGIKKRTVPASVLQDIMFAMVQPGQKYFGAAEKAGKTTGGVLGSFADVQQFFERGLGDAINGPLKLLLGTINADFAQHIPELTKYFTDLATAWNTYLTPIIDKFVNQDWSLTGKSFGTMMDTLGEDFQKMQPAILALVGTLPSLIEGLNLLAATALKLVGAISPNAVAPINRIDPNNPLNAGAGYQGQFGGRHFASGGIATSQMIAMLGEKGPEAVIPLSHEGVLDDLTEIMNNLNKTLGLNTSVLAGLSKAFGVGLGGGSGGGAIGSMLRDTIYGPGVAGDRPGEKNYDWDSYHGIGHIRGVPFKLGPGSAAMHPAYAKKLGVDPGGWFKNPRTGQQEQWNDTSGAANPENIDTFKGSSIHQTFNIYALDQNGVRDVMERHGSLILRHLDDVRQHKSSSSSLA